MARRVRVEIPEYYAHQIEATGGHIASIAGWSAIGTRCPTNEANARLLEHAPDTADALRTLPKWVATMEDWDAPCWRHAQQVVDHATRLDDRDDQPARDH